MTTRDTLRQLGETMRARPHGDRRPPAEIAAGESTPGFRQMMTEAVVGGIWARPGLALADRDLHSRWFRPGLDRRQRMLCAVAPDPTALGAAPCSSYRVSG